MWTLIKNDEIFYLKIQTFNQTIGVPVEGKVRIQLNLKVEQAKHINAVKNFRDIVFPIVWVEEVSVKCEREVSHNRNGKTEKKSLKSCPFIPLKVAHRDTGFVAAH